MTLIAVALGALSLQVSKALRIEKFERGVEQVISKLLLTQELMLDFRTDVSLTLLKDGKDILCTIETTMILPNRLEKSINRHQRIEGIDEMAFDNIFRDTIVICCDGSLGTMSEGVLTFISQDRQKSLLLKGYPSQHGRGKCEQKKECPANYPEEIFSAI